MEALDIITWAGGSWGLRTAICLVLLGPLMGVPCGTIVPAIEGSLLALAIHDGLPLLAPALPVVRDAVLLCGGCWLATYSIMVVRFFMSGSRGYVDWGWCSAHAVLQTCRAALSRR